MPGIAAQPAPELKPEATPGQTKPEVKPQRSHPTLFSRLRRKPPTRILYASQSYVEQCRTVHFALLSVSAALLLLILSAKPYDLQKAIVQLEDILRLKEIWNPGKIQSDLRLETNFVELYDPPRPRSYFIREPLTLTLGSGSTQTVATSEEPKFLEDFIWIGRPVLDFPDTLHQFAEWWADLGNTEHFFALPWTIEVENNCGRFRKKCSVSRAAHFAGFNDNQIHIKLAVLETPFLPVHTVRGDDLGVVGEITNTANSYPIVIFNTAGYRQVRIRQSDVMKRFPEIHKGKFPVSFPDLFQATKGELQSLTLQDALKHLNANNTGAETFEVFGLRIPAAEVTAWGTVVILCIQLYLFAYLRGLKRPLEPTDPAWDLGWFAANEAILQRAIFFVTAWILPALTVVLLAKHAMGQRLEFTPFRFHQEGDGAVREFLAFAHDFPAVWFILLGCCFSLLLGCLNWYNRPRVRMESAPPSRSQLFE